MNPSESTFRTAVVGGFNRQDVLNYIESSSRQHKERLAELRKEADAARKDGEAAREENQTLRERTAALEQEVEELRSLLTGTTTKRDTAQTALSQLQSEAEAMRKELTVLREKCAQWAKGAQAYADLKDRTATIELEARRRAQAIEDQAAQRARLVHAETEQLLSQVQAGYARLREDVGATLSHASGELGRVDKALSQVLTEFSEHDAALERLLASCREVPPKKEVPDPLPLEDA